MIDSLDLNMQIDPPACEVHTPIMLSADHQIHLVTSSVIDQIVGPQM